MSAVGDVDHLIEQYRLAAGEFLEGNPEDTKELFSHREDALPNPPYGPPVRG